MLNFIFTHFSATATTFKVNFSPYIIDVVLCGSIDPIKHKATVKGGVLSVKLFKAAPIGALWGKFHVIEVDSHDIDTATVKAEALAQHETLEKDLQSKRRDRRSEDERFSTRKQMALEVCSFQYNFNLIPLLTLSPVYQGIRKESP